MRFNFNAQFFLIGMISIAFLNFAPALNAQDTIKSLLISEVQMGSVVGYCELTNMGQESIDLHDFELGSISQITAFFHPNEVHGIFLGDYIEKYVPSAIDKVILDPGESLWITSVYDLAREKFAEDPFEFTEPGGFEGQWNADIVLHVLEDSLDSRDSVSVDYDLLQLNLYDHLFLKQHLPNGDTVLIDQVRTEFNITSSMSPSTDVAGYKNAMENSILVRKYSVKEGNPDFSVSRGANPENSEWLVIPRQNSWTWKAEGRKMMWTVGNHGDVHLNEETLTSDNILVDWENNVLNVPWGIHTRDSVMVQFDYQDGLAWHYQLSTDAPGGPNWEQAHIDSSYVSARTGDTLIVWACGNDREERKFHINLLEASEDANQVIPRVKMNDDGYYGDASPPAFRLTHDIPGADTIFDIPFATRTDTLLKYLEKAPEASWDFVFADSLERPDLMYGDILRVIAEDGGIRDYFLKVLDYRPSKNAILGAIAWPDVPETVAERFGYSGDTIPGFSADKYEYRLTVPLEVEGIPALVARTDDVNARIDMKGAVNMFGSDADRTITFICHAEGGETSLEYKVLLEKEQAAENIQPWPADPFISQYVNGDQFQNGMLELCNPGPHDLDLSNYMIMVSMINDPEEAIRTQSESFSWNDRYAKYIPGYKWLGETAWQSSPGRVEQDAYVDPVVKPGDVFVIGEISTRSMVENIDWWVEEEMDIDWADNPWGEVIQGTRIGKMWMNSYIYIWRIKNDSIKQGLKAAKDPDDFTLIECWGNPDGGEWIIGGRRASADNQAVTWIRKPGFYKGKTELGASFGTLVDNGTKYQDGTSEWDCYDENYGKSLGYRFPESVLYITRDLGKHSMDDVSEYLSTVYSDIFQVSLGYSMDEEIRGIPSGIKASEFLSGIHKKDEGQSLMLKRDGSSLSEEQELFFDDSLLVISADGRNRSRYSLEITDDNLFNDVLLTTSEYTIDVDGETGSVSEFDYGISLRELVSNLVIPTGASMEIINQEGLYVPFSSLMYDGTYKETQVSDHIYLKVRAEDRQTVCTYQLLPDSEPSDAFVLSDVYDVDQEQGLILKWPEGTVVSSFLRNLVSAPGASMEIVDKAGYVRNKGQLYYDDKLHVISEDGETKRTYYLSPPITGPLDNYAYVTSDIYMVDQISMIITAEPGILIHSTTIADFLSNLEPAPGASMDVIVENNTLKQETDSLRQGDLLRVISGDSVVVRYYSIEISVDVPLSINRSLNIFPNPTASQFRIIGLEPGSRVCIYSSTGALMLDELRNDTEAIFMLEESGMYFITVRNKNGSISSGKVLVR